MDIVHNHIPVIEADPTFQNEHFVEWMEDFEEVSSVVLEEEEEEEMGGGGERGGRGGGGGGGGTISMDVQSFSAQFVFGIDQYDEIETRSVDSAEQVGVVLFATRWKSVGGETCTAAVPCGVRGGYMYLWYVQIVNRRRN
jgi:hypothetical protein